MPENRMSFASKAVLFFISMMVSIVLLLLVIQVIVSRLPQTNAFASFFSDYFDVVSEKIESVSAKYFKVKRNSVETYQVNLVKQSIEDYLAIIRWQQDEIATTEEIEYISGDSIKESVVSLFKRKFYAMNVENPYLKSLTFFSITGDMLLHLYTTKGWNIKLRENLINEIKEKKSVVLHSETESVIYSLRYIKRGDKEFIVSTRTDNSFIRDIISYYRMADKTFFVKDGHGVNQIISSSEGEGVSQYAISFIGKYARYQNKANIVLEGVPGLSVSMLGKTYPEYFALITIIISAICISVVMVFFLILSNSISVVFRGRHITGRPTGGIEVVKETSQEKEEDTYEEDVLDAAFSPIYAEETVARSFISQIDMENWLVKDEKEETPISQEKPFAVDESEYYDEGMLIVASNKEGIESLDDMSRLGYTTTAVGKRTEEVITKEEAETKESKDRYDDIFEKFDVALANIVKNKNTNVGERERKRFSFKISDTEAMG